jgi:hypothetical protein
MRIPNVKGIIDRRILVNFRVDRQVLSDLLPSPFRPQLVGDYGIAGICLIRLKQIRPDFVPAFFGLSSENAAHRIAVTWGKEGETRQGVYIPRRDTSSVVNAFAGGRIFPGTHHRAQFDVQDLGDRFEISMRSADGLASVSVDAAIASEFPSDSIFSSVEEASRFFEAGSIGYSPDQSVSRFDGLELRAMNWRVQSLSVTRVQSSWFDDRSLFPEGSVTFDNALLMRGIHHEWHSRSAICCPEI